MRYGRDELARLVALRKGCSETEGQGQEAFLEGRIKVTVELVEQLIGGHWVGANGSKAELVAVSIDSDGLIYPEFAITVPADV